MKLKEMRERCAELHRQRVELHKKSVAEARDFTEAEQAEFDVAETEIGKLKAIMAREQALLDAEADEPADSFSQPDPNPEKRDFANFGERLVAVYNACKPGGRVDPRLKAYATGANETTGADGGFLVGTETEAAVITRAVTTSNVWNRARSVTVGANANGLKVNAVNETDRAVGSRWGGVRGYWLEEGGTKTKSKPTFRQIELRLKKMIGLAYATDELLADTVALGQVFEQAFASEFAFMLDDAAINGTGAGQPLGLLNAGCTVSVAKDSGQAAATITSDNVFNMYSRLWSPSLNTAVWFINQACWPQLFKLSQAVGVGGVPMFIPAGGMNATPAGTLLGRPIVPIEQCAALGTVGDIIFADMSEYLTINKGGVESASSIHVQFTTDETTFRWVYRVDGMPVWNTYLTPYKDTGKTVSPFITLATRA